MAVPGYAIGHRPESTQVTGQKTAAARKVIARVNGKPIYEDQVNPEVKSGLERFRRYGMRREDPNLAKRLQKRALDRLIGDELVFQESRKLTIEDIDTKVEQKLKSLESKYGQEEGMERYLRMRNLTMKKVRESLKTRVYLDEYLKQQGILEPKIPEKRIRQAYEDNPKNYSRKESIKVSHVLIAVDEKAEPEAKERARQEAEQIRKEILEGQDFAEMARKHSDCDSASGGGSLKYVKRGYMPEGFDKVAFAMEKDALSEVVETRFGYHIIKVFDKRSAGKIPYEEVRNFIMKFLQEGESKKKLAAHIVKLRSRAKIELFLAE
jgi:peptidyl-prolyl cis-trans isomerase C